MWQKPHRVIQLECSPCDGKNAAAWAHRLWWVNPLRSLPLLRRQIFPFGGLLAADFMRVNNRGGAGAWKVRVYSRWKKSP